MMNPPMNLQGRSQKLLLLAIGLLILGCAPAAEPRAESSATPTTSPAILSPDHTAIPGVRNFAMVSPTLYRGEQPTAEGFANLKSSGVKTIVSLRSSHDDKPLLRGTGLQYAWIPSHQWHAEEEDLIEFLKVVENPNNAPVFLHCQAGSDRTGYCIAGYRVVVQNWSADEAIEEMRQFGFNEIWGNIPNKIRAMNPSSIREQMKAADNPEIQIVD